MSYWTLIQVIFNLFIFATISAIFWRLRRPPQDDPRLSRGLQLLQTKITVLEDLSDRTEAQVKQLTSLIDQKTRALQNKVIEAEQQIIKIDHSMAESADLVQENIPHAEMVERQRTIDYVKAARMANSGATVDQIAQKIQMPREQLELIAKFNREQLMFDESQLPEWAAKAAAKDSTRDSNKDFGSMGDMDFVGGLDKPPPDFKTLTTIENNFKQAVEKHRRADVAATQSIMDTKMGETIKAGFSNSMETMQPAVMAVRATAQTFRDKLVATAEDMLRHQQQPPFAAPLHRSPTDGPLRSPAQTFMTIKHNPVVSTNAFNIGDTSPIVRDDKATVKKVIFPRIEKPPGG